MHLRTLLFVIFFHKSLAFLKLPYPNITFELPKHPSNWICTVHVTVATFASYTSSDITERFLTSNGENIIPTISTLSNRSISIAPVVSFFEQCTISIFVDATINGSSYVFNTVELPRYVNSNEYIYRGWKHSLVIFIYFSCSPQLYSFLCNLPVRLFFHSTACGPQNIFPNIAFIPDPLIQLMLIEDPTYSIHHPQLPTAMRRLISTPKYFWDEYQPNGKHDICLTSRWDGLSKMEFCTVERFAVQHFQHYLNFTTVANVRNKAAHFGKIMTNIKYRSLERSIQLHAIDSRNDRVIYCDRNSDSPRLCPILVSSPFSFQNWVIFFFILVLCAITSSFAVFDWHSARKDTTKTVIFTKTIFSHLVVLCATILENSFGKGNCLKILIGLLVIYLGNDYKNYLTIELVYPREGDAIRNVTELLDLNFNIIMYTDSSLNKSSLLTVTNSHLEIDEAKREKYVREADRFLKLLTLPSFNWVRNELASPTERNSWILSAPYHIQVHSLNRIRDRNYPLSCHFVKLPFAHDFGEFYFFNPKAEECKWLTTKFLEHGLFEFWKVLDLHKRSLELQKISLDNGPKWSNGTTAGAQDRNNFIGQAHFFVFYMVILILAGICVLIFLSECAIKNARQLSRMVLTKFKQFSLELLWAVVRFLYLMSRLIGGSLYENRNPL
jgi:hypothetical protein